MTMDSQGLIMVTGDTAGRLKMWDISKVNWRKDGFTKEGIKQNMRERWFIHAHKSVINSLVIVESFFEKTGQNYILTAGQDCNILLHTTKGERIG